MNIGREDENGQLFQVYQQTEETYDIPAFQRAPNVRYEQSQPATDVAGAVSSGYQSGGIQESRTDAVIGNLQTHAGVSEHHTAEISFLNNFGSSEFDVQSLLNDSLPQDDPVEGERTADTDSTTPMWYFEPRNTDVIDSIPSPEDTGPTSEIGHQPVRQPTDGQLFQVYQQTEETYDIPAFQRAPNVRYEQSQPATDVAGAVSSGYQSGGIQENRTDAVIGNLQTHAGVSEHHTAGPAVDLRKCCLCQQRNFRASQKPCGHCVCENCCVRYAFQSCKRCGQIVTEVWAMDPAD
ncbi:uncharacterized protein LOC128236465 [Mya arenaria]|uniref:uncharacterized protein LOC128236465 n=1 Tax=Mya arenaria TaxID=6604 RepID=UPI0022E17DA6|nr:uncharacterized protein LOC128236465 [Mya arenaria]XP_052807294.1 uncharacterized protein LOC128236465 [Mya arenaria]